MEEVCSSNTTGRITSGGGFSTVYPQPKWQASAVSNYFTEAAAAGETPIPGFNRSGRAYPDISAMGVNFLVMYGGSWIGMAGTSASCPVVAGFISNINAARMAVGKGPVGWVTPAMYKHADLFVNDIVTGNNKCSATAPCCPHGYTAAPGWDPASGLGSINYGKMQDTFVNLGEVNAMTDPPTQRPTSAPTFAPTAIPTRFPTARPSISLNPTQYVASARPTRRLTRAPIARPSRRPTATKVNGNTNEAPTDSSSQVPSSTIESVIQVTQVRSNTCMLNVEYSNILVSLANRVVYIILTYY